MRFKIEQTYLTDGKGSVIPSPADVRFHILDAPTVEDALKNFVRSEHGELVGDVVRFPGFHLVATAKQDKRVYTLHVDPVTDHFDKDLE